MTRQGKHSELPESQYGHELDILFSAIRDSLYAGDCEKLRQAIVITEGLLTILNRELSVVMNENNPTIRMM